MSLISNSEQIEAAAAAWFAKREGGNWSASDQAELDTWLDRATAHRIAFIRIAAAWERAGRLKALGAGVPPGTIPPRAARGIAPAPQADSSAGINKRLGAIAAGLIVAAAGAAVWYITRPQDTAYSTPIGALASVPLSDGSQNGFPIAVAERDDRISLTRR